MKRKRLLLMLFFIATLIYGSLKIPDFQEIKVEKKLLLYDLEKKKSEEVVEELHNDIYHLKLDRNDFKTIMDSIINKSILYYNDKYKLDTLDVAALVDSSFEDLQRSSYFRKRIKKWSDSTALEYLTFRAELNLINFKYSDFKLEEFKDTECYTYLTEGLISDSITSVTIDSILSKIAVYGYNPLHFYYKPNSVKEQWKEDKIDINRLDFVSMMKFYNKYLAVLTEAEKRYKVNKEVIIGILKRETNLGKVKLKYNPFEVLLGQATRYINNPASELAIRDKQEKRIERLRGSARRSLKHLIRYCVKNKIDTDSLKSNFVGAVGYTQFMPFNLYLARDGDKDGVADLSNMNDAIMSIGNFFNSNGWQKKYDLKKKNERRIKKFIMRYNSNPSYAQAVFDIARRIKLLAGEKKN